MAAAKKYNLIAADKVRDLTGWIKQWRLWIGGCSVHIIANRHALNCQHAVTSNAFNVATDHLLHSRSRGLQVGAGFANSGNLAGGAKDARGGNDHH